MQTSDLLTVVHFEQTFFNLSDVKEHSWMSSPLHKALFCRVSANTWEARHDLSALGHQTLPFFITSRKLYDYHTPITLPLVGET